MYTNIKDYIIDELNKVCPIGDIVSVTDIHREGPTGIVGSITPIDISDISYIGFNGRTGDVYTLKIIGVDAEGFRVSDSYWIPSEDDDRSHSLKQLPSDIIDILDDADDTLRQHNIVQMVKSANSLQCAIRPNPKDYIGGIYTVRRGIINPGMVSDTGAVVMSVSCAKTPATLKVVLVGSDTSVTSFKVSEIDLLEHIGSVNHEFMDMLLERQSKIDKAEAPGRSLEGLLVRFPV